MRGGQNKKSSQLKILEGRPVGDYSPKPAPIFPVKPPRGIFPKEAKFARQLWETYGPMLERCGIVTELDIPAFGNLCMTYETIRQSEVKIQEDGLLIEGRKGEPVKNPLTSVLNAARQAFRLQAQEFGLSPHSRERLNVQQDPGKEEPMEKLLSGIKTREC
ncbi:phage terminase small subunit P27 family [Candidatus Contubernalis alkaliaceticus]|uniref:phage terminase small subunit P27 family n=1 Tax=Candidatus Contubernalis alkaliaceticus TaxID=338645 RepID=UPI001F4C093E|nr:phage terminase small subunit P27 family [Candidatus Contubernalis alkalaceticus]UNC92412.1 phage terminase small subunit P27 family [Candidatus Contubernalis alkalaceticus]